MSALTGRRQRPSMRLAAVAVVAATTLLAGFAPAAAQASGKVDVYVTFEGYNVGKGYFVPPTKVTVAEGSTQAEATVAALKKAGVTANYAGTPTNGFYLTDLGVSDRFTPKVPSYLSSQPEFKLGKSNGDGKLGNGDFNGQAGWMSTYDNQVGMVGAADLEATQGQVIRWQFTLYGYGCDLGLAAACWGTDPFYKAADKTDLIRKIAAVSPSDAAVPVVVSAKTVALAPTASASKVASAKKALLTAKVDASVKGSAKVGSRLTATASKVYPTNAKLTYQWYADGKAVKGATSSSLLLSKSVQGKRVTVRVGATRAGYTGAADTSARSAKVLGALDAVTPKISGSARVGSTLKAHTGSWGPGKVSLTYAWFRDGKQIPGIKGSTYTMGSASKGKKITVKVTGEKSGYGTVTKTSKATARVK